MNKIKVILDCDTKNEIDDQFAIAYALKDPKIDLLGVVSVQNTKVSGIDSIDKYDAEAKKIIKLCKSKIPTFKGSRHPLKSKDKPEESPGVRFIIDSILKSKKKIYIVGTGPCTDLVNACLIEPKIKKKCKFIWLGGFRNNKIAKKDKWKECNFDGDKLGTKILGELEIDLILLPAKGVASQMIRNTQSFIEKLEDKNTPLTKYLAELIRSINSPWESWIFWDLAAPAVAKNFGVIKKKIIPSYKVNNGKFFFPKKGKNKITIIDSVNELEILNQSEKYILR